MPIDKEIDILAGVAKAPKTIKTYDGIFKRCAQFRYLQSNRYLAEPPDDRKSAELDMLRFATLQFDQLQKSGASVALYFAAVAYVRRVQIGVSPREGIRRIKPSMQDAKGMGGPPRRKFQISREDLIATQWSLDPYNVDEMVIFALSRRRGILCLVKSNT